MKKLSIFKIFSLSLVFLLTAALLFTTDEAQVSRGCSSLVAGRNATVDGSILFVKTEDDGYREVDHLWYVPRKTYEPSAVLKLQSGGKVPQVRETYAYFWDQCPGTSFSNQYINEWGVAFGSNACASKEDSVEKLV